MWGIWRLKLWLGSSKELAAVTRIYGRRRRLYVGKELRVLQDCWELSELWAANLSTSLLYRQNLFSSSITQKFSTKNWMPPLRLNCKRIIVSGQLPSTRQLLSSTTKWPTKFLAWMCMPNCKWCMMSVKINPAVHAFHSWSQQQVLGPLISSPMAATTRLVVKYVTRCPSYRDLMQPRLWRCDLALLRILSAWDKLEE